MVAVDASMAARPLTLDARRVSIRARMPNQHAPERYRERHPPMVVEVDHAVVLRLRPQAARRDVSVQRLTLDLIDVIVRDGLTAAVLDADDSKVRDG
jgi:hypothetical protein